MKRPLVILGGLFVTGELTCRLGMIKNLYHIFGIAAGLLIITICNKFMLSNKKSINLLLFLSFISGYMWGYGYYYSKVVLSPGDYLSGSAYIEKVQDAEKGMKVYIKTSAGKFLVYVDEKFASKKDSSEKYTSKKDLSEKYASKKDLSNKDSSEKYVSNKDEDIWDAGENAESKWERIKSIFTSGDNDIEPGKYINIRGKVCEFKGATNPGSMDMADYYHGLGITYRLDADEISADASRRNIIVNSLYHLRLRIKEKIILLFDDESEGILCTMLLGDRDMLEQDTKLLFQRSGIAHILAISGLHVALIAGVLEWLLSRLRLRRSISSWIVMGTIILYGILTGLSAATLRAVIMICISRLAFLFKRTPDMPSSMMEALLLMVIINPDSLFSSGMLMSFMAILGVWTGQLFYRRIFGKERFLKLPEKMRGVAKSFLNTVTLSAAVNLWMIPMVMMNYYEIPVFSMVLNFILIPLLTFVIACAVLGILFAGIPFVGQICIWSCESLLRFYSFMCRMFLRIPGSVYTTGHVEVWQMVLIYGVIILALVIMYKVLGEENGETLDGKHDSKQERKYDSKQDGKQDSNHDTKHDRKHDRKSLGRYFGKLKNSKRMLLCFLVVMAVSASMMIFVRLSNICGDKVIFLDVGQGDGSIIHESPDSIFDVIVPGKGDGRNYIVDCGSSSKDQVGQFVLIPALKYFGISSVDIIFVSHTDEDHVSGIKYLLEYKSDYGIQVDNVAIARGTEDENSDINDDWMKNKLYGENTYKNQNESQNERQNKSQNERQNKNINDYKKENIQVGNFERIRQLCSSNTNPTKILDLGKGDEIKTEGHSFSVLYPNGDEAGEHSGNDYSLVLLYKTSQTEILYTGDISSEVEEKIISELDGEILESQKSAKSQNNNILRILKCPHHGSRFSSSERFLKTYNPDLTIISCGENNFYGHPHRETLERLKEVGTKTIRTDERGAMIIDN